MGSSATCGRRTTSRRRSGSRALAGVLALLLLLPLTAGASPDPDDVARARAIARQGFAAYDRKEYAAAISLFARAYELAPEAGLLYNIAQAYRQIGPSACDEALTYYRRFLGEPESARGRVTRETIDARISEMEACVERRRSDAQIAEPGAEASANLGPDSSLALDGSEPEPRRDSGRRTAGWIIAGAGGATLGLAVIAGSMALKRRGELDDSCSGGVCPPDYDDEVASYDRWRYTAFVAGGAGAVAVGVGVWMLMTSDRGGSRSGRRAAAPWVGRGTVGVSLWF
jgi:hypothetical protein